MGLYLRTCFLLLWLLPATLLPAQEVRPMLQMDFSRQNSNTFSSLVDLNLQKEKGPYRVEATLHHDNLFNNSQDNARFIQVYLSTSVWQYYQVKPRLSVASWIETDQYITTENHKLSGYAGVEYRPADYVRITPLLGYAWDVRSGILDQGFSPALVARLDRDLENGLSTQNYLMARYKFIDPRRQYNLQLMHRIGRVFNENTELNFTLNASTHELDDYVGATGVKQIISDSIQPALNLRYRVLGGWEWYSENMGNVYRRRFNFVNLAGPAAMANDLRFAGMDMRTAQTLALSRERWEVRGTYAFEFSTRSYDLQNSMNLPETQFRNAYEQEKEKDYLKRTHKWELATQFRPGRRHLLAARLANQYLLYDTPSDRNYDDRDELSYSGGLDWNWQVRRNFSSTLSLSGNYRHYAFLFSEKSQDNYIQRSLRADYRFQWQLLPSLRVDGEQAVYVTYNVKDFFDFNKTDRSTRNLESNYKLQWKPGSRTQIRASLLRKEIQLSYLNWDAFTETTLDTTRFQTTELMWRRDYRPAGGGQWYWEAGYRHFLQTKQRQALLLTLDNTLQPIYLKEINQQTGPVIAGGLRGRKNRTLDLSLWAQMQVKSWRWDAHAQITTLGTPVREAEIQTPVAVFRPFPTFKLVYWM